MSEPRRIVVEIGDLVLDGFPPALRRDVVASAFRRELTRLLTGFTGARSAGSPPSRRLGEEIARSVYATLDGAW